MFGQIQSSHTGDHLECDTSHVTTSFMFGQIQSSHTGDHL